MTRKNRLRAKVRPFSEHMFAIGDVHRMSVLYLLAHGPMDAREIADHTGLHPSLLSHHLKILLECNWVTRHPYGKRAEYRLNPKAFFVLEKLFRDTVVGREIFPEKGNGN